MKLSWYRVTAPIPPSPANASAIPTCKACDVMNAVAKVEYSAIVLGATGNVGGRIVQILIRNPLCKKVVVVTRRKTGAFADPKVYEVVVNMDRLEEEIAPHAQ